MPPDEQVEFKRLDRQAIVPSYAHPGDAGLDLCSVEDVSIPAGQSVGVRTGLAVSLPEGTVGLLFPRSGLARNFSLTLQNAVGVIDAGYRGEIVALVRNENHLPYLVGVGDRIAQLVVFDCPRYPVVEVSNLDNTARGVGGFGSTGT